MTLGQPLLFSGRPLYVVTGRKLDESVEHIAFYPDWDVAVQRAADAITHEGFKYTYVSVIHTSLSA